ncbi:MAG: ribbon-helix-helix domain-containing protein [Pseudomonadota bacterium]
MNRSRLLQTRVTPEEGELLDQLVKAHGFKSRSTALRALIRISTGLLETDPAIIRAWKDFARSNVKIGNNINQLTRKVNRGELIWKEEDRRLVEAVRQNVHEVNRLLADYLQEMRVNGAKRVSVLAQEDGG